MSDALNNARQFLVNFHTAADALRDSSGEITDYAAYDCLISEHGEQALEQLELVLDALGLSPAEPTYEEQQAKKRLYCSEADQTF